MNIENVMNTIFEKETSLKIQKKIQKISKNGKI
jgi:hypothetical protein